MSVSPAFVNFPNLPLRSTQVLDFTKDADRSSCTFTSVGHTSPAAVGAYKDGGILLGSGSASANDHTQFQKIGASVQINELAQTYNFLFAHNGLSAANLTQCMMGVFGVNTNFLGTNLVNGIGFMANMNGYSNGPAAGFWQPFISVGSGAQFTGYNILPPGLATDTLAHTFAIQVITDSQNLGVAQVVFKIDGNIVGVAANTGAVNIPQVVLTPSAAMGNSSAVAQSVVWTFAGADSPR